MAAYRRVDDLPAGWLPVHRDQLWAQRLVPVLIMGSLYLTFTFSPLPTILQVPALESWHQESLYLSRAWGQVVGVNASCSLQCFDTVGWVTGRTLACEKPALIVLNLAQLGVTLLLYDWATCATTTVIWPFSRTTRVSRCQKRTSGLYGARVDLQRQTHRPSGWAPLHPPFFTGWMLFLPPNQQ